MKKNFNISNPSSYADIFHVINKFIEIEYHHDLVLVNTKWRDFHSSSTYWKNKLCQDFGISIFCINELEENNKNNGKYFERLYKKLRFLKQEKNQKLLEKCLFFSFLELLQDPLILAACLDDDTYYFSHVETIINHQDACIINIFAGGHKITRRLLQGRADLIESFLIDAAIKSSNLIMVRDILEKWKKQISLEEMYRYQHNLLKQACILNHPEDVKFLINLFEPSFELIQSILNAVIGMSGNLSLVQSLFEKYPMLQMREDYLLYNSKDFNIVKWIYNKYSFEPSLISLKCAVLRGNIDITKWFLQKFSDTMKSEIASEADVLLINAASSGSLELVQYLCEELQLKPRPNHLGILQQAARSGNLELVRYLCEVHQLRPNLEVLQEAALNGELVRYICREEYQLHPDLVTLQYSVFYGELELVQYLCEEHQLQPDMLTLSEAASSGNLNLLQYLLRTYSYLIPDSNILIAAVNTANIRIPDGKANHALIKWLYENYFQNSGDDMIHLIDSKIFTSCYTIQYLLDLQFDYQGKLDSLEYQKPERAYEVQSDRMISCNLIFRKGLKQAKSGDFDPQIFINAYNQKPEYFYHLLNTVLMHEQDRDTELIRQLLTMEIIQKTPLAQSQYILACCILSDQHYLGAVSAMDLLDAAKESFTLLGQFEMAEKAEVMQQVNDYRKKLT